MSVHGGFEWILIVLAIGIIGLPALILFGIG